jgi:cytochrome c oxidase subunit 4
MDGVHSNISGHVRIYLVVFALLAVGTVATVLAAQFDLGGHLNIILALLIALGKASLVATIFMHLRWERAPSIWWLLALSAVFLLALLLLPVLTAADLPPQAQLGSWG